MRLASHSLRKLSNTVIHFPQHEQVRYSVNQKFRFWILKVLGTLILTIPNVYSESYGGKQDANFVLVHTHGLYPGPTKRLRFSN